MRVALCPEGKPRVTFDSCWSAEEKHSDGSNIAEQVNAEGFATAEYTERCLYQQYEATKENREKVKDYDPPIAEPSSEYREFKKKEFPAPEPAKPASEKADPKAK